MRYISEVDNKVFNTEQECMEHENAIKKSREEELKRKEKLQMERQSRLDNINRKYEELQKLITDYRKDYGVRMEGYFTPFQELVNMLYR